MNEQIQGEFLRKRMVELREKNGKSQSDMAKLINCNKSTLSRVEGGSSSYKTILEFANLYCDKLQLTEEQKQTEKKRIHNKIYHTKSQRKRRKERKTHRKFDRCNRKYSGNRNS